MVLICFIVCLVILALLIFDQSFSKAAVELMRLFVRFKPEIIHLAYQIASRLKPFNAVHVRRGDFINQYPMQNISSKSIIQTITKYIPPMTRLYISTDETSRSFFDDFSKHYKVVFLSNITSSLQRKISAESLACIEQVICSVADIFVGTRLSTFSGYITRLRGYRNAADKTVYFTDGYRIDDGIANHEDLFSWVPWIKSGNPLWGREYEEGLRL